jgi:hypothetical protein
VTADDRNAERGGFDESLVEVPSAVTRAAASLRPCSIAKSAEFLRLGLAGPQPGAEVLVPTSVPPRVLNERQPHPYTVTHPQGPHYSDAELRIRGATADELWIIHRESSGYVWAWNPYRTSTGHAYGLGQITGYFRWKYFGTRWESADPHLQIQMMKLYIRIGSSHFHTDAGAKAFWEANGYY